MHFTFQALAYKNLNCDKHLNFWNNCRKTLRGQFKRFFPPLGFFDVFILSTPFIRKFRQLISGMKFTIKFTMNDPDWTRGRMDLNRPEST